MKERFNLTQFRLDRIFSHSRGDQPSFELPPEIEEGGLVEPLRTPQEMQPNRPVDLTPYEANQIMHWEQRKRNRRVINGKK